MRINSGKHKGRRLKKAKKAKTRPITNLAKEKLFGYLNSSISDKRVLDLYAGTGSFGIEAISRGSKQITFVESNYSAFKAISHNVEACNEKSKSSIQNQEVEKFIKRNRAKYDIVFSAPPYNIVYYEKFMKLIDKYHETITDDGKLIMECNKKRRSVLKMGKFNKIHEIECDDTVFEVWIKRP